eukprot:3531216-Pyramimonas_sp.AAC.1
MSLCTSYCNRNCNCNGPLHAGPNPDGRRTAVGPRRAGTSASYCVTCCSVTVTVTVKCEGSTSEVVDGHGVRRENTPGISDWRKTKLLPLVGHRICVLRNTLCLRQ